jgi:hypothetical protein
MCENVCYTDSNIYRLAQIVRSKLCQEASNDHQDLRRILGHANLLDYLTVELINLGFEQDTDDAFLTEAVVAENELSTSLGHNDWTIQHISLPCSESSEDSDDTDSCHDSACDSDSDSDSDSPPSFEGEDDYNDRYGDHEYASTAHLSKLPPSQAAIQVSVREINEFDEDTKFLPHFVGNKGYPSDITSNGWPEKQLGTLSIRE